MLVPKTNEIVHVVMQYMSKQVDVQLCNLFLLRESTAGLVEMTRAPIQDAVRITQRGHF